MPPSPKTTIVADKQKDYKLMRAAKPTPADSIAETPIWKGRRRGSEDLFKSLMKTKVGAA